MAGYGFNERYALKWLRGEEIRLVHSHVRLVLLAIADVRGKGVVLGGAVGPPYASEDRRTYLPALPVVGDRGYFRSPTCASDESDLALLLASHKSWEKWKARRNRIEGLFGVFPLFREDLALKRALASAVLYNLDRLVTLFLFFLKGSLRPLYFGLLVYFSNTPFSVMGQ